jgi:hypothetical protein
LKAHNVANKQTKRKEFNRLLPRIEIVDFQSSVNNGYGHWQDLVIYQFGEKFEPGCEVVPETCLKVSEFLSESVECSRCQIKIAVLQSGNRVLPKSGPTNTRLRSYLGNNIERTKFSGEMNG